MTFYDVGVVHVTEDLDLPADLTADRLFMVPVDNLEGIRARGRAVDDFVNGASGTAPYPVDAVELGEVDLLRQGVGVGGGGRGGVGGGRKGKRDGERRVTLREG